MASSSSFFPSVSQQELNAFHKSDRALFTRLVIHLKRDVNQSLKVMSFLFYLEKSEHRHLKNLILNLLSLPQAFTQTVAEEVILCMICLYSEDFSTVGANSKMNIKSLTIPVITRASEGNLTLQVIHENRENILLEMEKHLNTICYPVFEDICVWAETEARNRFFNNHEATRKVGALSENEQFREEDRTVFLRFSEGYPFSEEEVHAYFTWHFGEIIEAIIMLEGNSSKQAVYAKMVLHSPAMIPEIVSRYKYTINGKDVWAVNTIS